MDMTEFHVGDIVVSMYDVDDRQVRHLQIGDGYEEQSLKAWSEIVRPGEIALDVGAYTGLFSIVAAKVGAAKVYAFEPMGEQRNRFRKNVAFNLAADDDIIKLLPTAVSDYCGIGNLHFNTSVRLTSGASLVNNPMHRAAKIVPVLKIDAVAFTSRVAAIKIDVERGEPEVIKGALKTIERDRPMLLVETLEAEMRSTLLDLLPGYDAVAVLDRRNTMFAPRGETSWVSPLQAPHS